MAPRAGAKGRRQGQVPKAGAKGRHQGQAPWAGADSQPAAGTEVEEAAHDDVLLLVRLL